MVGTAATGGGKGPTRQEVWECCRDECIKGGDGNLFATSSLPLHCFLTFLPLFPPGFVVICFPSCIDRRQVMEGGRYVVHSNR